MTENTVNTSSESDEIDLGKIAILALDNWFLFVISISLSLGASYSYLWYTHPVYQMSTTVMVDDGKGDISQTILDEVGVRRKKRNIENEIAILSSRSLMEKAMVTLDLNVFYKINLGMRKRDLYLDSPLKLTYTLSEKAPSAIKFYVSLSENGTSAVLTYNARNTDGEKEEREQKIVLGEQFSNEYGDFRLLKTEHFDTMASGAAARSLNYEVTYINLDRLTSIYLGRLSVTEAREKASILKLTLQDNIGLRGEDVLTAILNVFIRTNIEKKNQLAYNSLQFIEHQLEVITSELNTLEEKIKHFKSVNGISDISAEASFFLEQVGTLDKTISGIDIKLSIIKYLEDYITSGKDLKNASPSSLGLEDPLLQKLIVRLSELSAERESMLKFTKEDNPLVGAVDTKIIDTKTSLANNITSIRNGLLASKKEVVSQLSVVEEKEKNLPKAEYELLALQRQYSIKESLYLLLLEKKSNNSILLASTVSDNVVIDKPRSSDAPIKPKKSMIYLMCLTIGFGIPSIYILLIVIFDNRIKDTDDLKRSTKIPFLGIIPHRKEKGYVVVHHKTNSAISESFRSIRTNLSFLIRGDELDSPASSKVTQLTSSTGSEGKSFCSINLSASLALGGSKTIVVGLDLRKPKLAEYFGLSNNLGASSVLAGHNTLEETIKQTKTERLDVLVAGPTPPNPSELLMSKALPKMLEELTQQYDQIVLDTPPIGMVTDSLIISEHAATTIYVVRQNQTNKVSLGYINDLYATKKIKSLSILFNDVKASRFGYEHGYGYGDYVDEQPQGLFARIKGFLRLG